MKVSVLIPAYNVEKYVAQCLESVCKQTHHDLQIVVIDDGSKDSTFDIISKPAEKDGRIEVISRENRGVAQTRNELLDRAKGDFVLFVDSDDWIEPDMISTLISLSEEYSVDLTMCRSVSSDARRKKQNENAGVWAKDVFLNKFMEHRELTGSLWNKLIRRTLFDGIRFNPEISYGEDAMVMWDILNRIDKMAYTTKGFYHYRMNDTSISHQGLSESKMSVIRVWDYISDSEYTSRNYLTNNAKARYGAEITLLLLGSINDENTKQYKDMVRILRNKLKELFPYVWKSKNLSLKFKLFSCFSLLGWPLLKYSSQKIR